MRRTTTSRSATVRVANLFAQSLLLVHLVRDEEFQSAASWIFQTPFILIVPRLNYHLGVEASRCISDARSLYSALRTQNRFGHCALPVQRAEDRPAPGCQTQL